MASKSTHQETFERSMKGFQRADHLLGPQIQRASEGRGFAVARLLTHWAEIAGEDLAQATRPVRVSYGRGGFGATLVLLVRGAQAPLIQAELPKLKDRVNACYGYAAISRIQLTQTAPVGFSEGKVDFDHRPQQSRPDQPDPEAVKEASRMANGIKNEGLRNALSQMGSHILKPARNEEGKRQ